LVSLVAVVGVRATQPPSVAQQDVSVPATPGWHNAIDGTNRWDAGWLERIARDGYDWNDQSAAFFPGYPLAIRALAATTPLDEATAGLLVSNAAFLTALVVLYALNTREFSTSTARRTVVLVAAYRPLVSAPRYIMVLFPIFWTMANTLTGRWFYVTLATFVAGFLWLSVLFMNRGLIP
jgi:Gpi18-like mannosyltransferase